SDTAPVDPNGPLGNDNRGDSEFLSLPGNAPDGDDGDFVDGDGSSIEDAAGIAVSTTDAKGEAVIRFRVTHQPGDNYEIRAARDPAAFEQGDFEVKTPILTVWRRLRFEIDKVGAPEGQANSQLITIASVSIRSPGVLSDLEL